MSLTTGAAVTGPKAPGRLGEAIDPAAALTYLEALGQWRDGRRRELDLLDQAALASPRKQELTSDLTLAMALWKAVADRYELLLATWDSGRVGQSERERISVLIWGRLDATAGQSTLPAGASVSLPEACRLSDALASQLRVRLALDPSGLETADRLKSLRATMERLRDQVQLEPTGQGRDIAVREAQRLAERTTELAARAERGGDIGGMIGPLEAEAARFERDLIVGAATRHRARAKADRAEELRAELEAREGALRKVADQCIATLETAPRYAVPDVDALGAVPIEGSELDRYLHRLDQVSRALSVAHQAYSKALHGHEELSQLLAGYLAKAEALKVADDPELAEAYQRAQQELDRRPVRMGIAEQLVEVYSSYVNWRTR